MSLPKGPAAFCTYMVAFFGAMLAIDQFSDERGQAAIAAATWVVLFLACRPLSAERRAQALLVVCVATCGEILGSRTCRSSSRPDTASST